MEQFDEIRARAARCGGRVVLPEFEDPRVLRAARQLVREGIARPLLVGETSGVRRAAAAAGVELDGIELVDPATDPRLP